MELSLHGLIISGIESSSKYPTPRKITQIEEFLRLTIEDDFDYSNFKKWCRSYPKLSPFDPINGVNYITFLLRHESLATSLQPGHIAEFYTLRGIYHLYIENTFETFQCVISFRADDMTIYATYNNEMFEITEFSKYEWIDAILEFDSTSLKYQGMRYWLLWGVNPPMDVYWRYQYSVTKPIRITKILYRQLV